jgi:uridylate kinase
MDVGSVGPYGNVGNGTASAGDKGILTRLQTALKIEAIAETVHKKRRAVRHLEKAEL